MFGKILLYVTFISSILTILLYYLGFKNKIKSPAIPRTTFHLSVISVLLASSYLLSLILNHQFQYTYVWEYSSKDLSLPLLISSFYAGQEGSFLLWLLFSSIIGIFLLSFLKKYNDYESSVMMVYMFVIMFLSLLLILKSPFEYIWETFPKEARTGFIPEDGRGLNPILQNFWMVIHPPILFIGFAAFTIPFAFSISALLLDKFQKWISLALPWLLFATGILGAGIVLGAFWAYGVLGWGGYWSWDPVENSSLIPWIFGVAAVHTMIAQQVTKKYVITNILLNIFAFLFVLYSTFLTRSGILSDASVHSFVKPGNEVYITLILFILIFLFFSIFIFLLKLKTIKKYIDTIPSYKREILITSRETTIYIGSIILIISAILIIAGTSLPIIASSKVEPNSYYNPTNMILAVAFTLLAGLAFFLNWEKPAENIFKKSRLSLLFSIISIIPIGIFAISNFYFLFFIFICLFTFFVNLIAIIERIKIKNFSFGFAIGHLGITLFLIGVVASARYSEEVNLELEKNVPAEAFGYKFTYFGDEEFIDKYNQKDLKYYLFIRAEKDGEEMIMKPVMYLSSYMNSVMKEPYIASFLTKDLYLSPLELIAPQQFKEEQVHIFKKGDEKSFDKLKIKFLDIDVSQIPMHSGSLGDKEYSVFSIIQVQKDNKKDTVKLKLNYKKGIQEPEPTRTEIDTNYTFYFTGLNVTEKQSGTTVKIAVVDSSEGTELQKEKLIVAVSIKPFIGILWVGSFLLILGFFYSIFNRIKMIRNNTNTKR
ncbi:MAG: cytochrome c biogenesis protein CcsA [Ignavibacteria bacterium]|nr:cytochrome c biogenesis protein CcsA [Ignavibacteria bacterium]